MASGDTKTEDLLDILGNGGDASEYDRRCCNTKTQNYILDAIDRMDAIEEDIEELKNNPDVVDIVATYADLQAYDTSKLTDKDVIRVLADENHDGDSTYYRYTKSSDSFTYIGESKQYTNFVGTDGTAAGTSGLVPAPATTDAGKYLNADGTWQTVQAGPTVVQTKGTSTTDVMSQDATTKMIYPDITNDNKKIVLGGDSYAYNSACVAINGHISNSGTSIAIGSSDEATIGSNGSSIGCIAIGNKARIYKGARNVLIGTESLLYSGTHNVLIGNQSCIISNSSDVKYSVGLGAFSNPTLAGQVDISTGASNYGYNSTNYRLLSGVHDPQSAHDAATKGYVDSYTNGIKLLQITQTDYDNLQNKDANTLYIITGA